MRLPLDAVGCRALFFAVVRQALTDALHLKPDSIERQQADQWIRRGGPDFRFVCDLAGVDPTGLRERYVRGQIDLSRYTRNGSKLAGPSKHPKAA